MIGVLHFGVSTRFLREATATLLQQSIAIAAAEVAVGLGILVAIFRDRVSTDVDTLSEVRL